MGYFFDAGPHLQWLFLEAAAVNNNESCPENPMNCFVFADKKDPLPSSQLNCSPGAIAQFHTASDDVAWCYGWVIQRQTTRKVLDQIGICGGLIAYFATGFASIVYLSKYTRWIWFLVVILVIGIIIAMILFDVLKTSLSFLTYATLSLCCYSALCALLFSFSVGQLKDPCFRRKNINKSNRIEPELVETTAPPLSVVEV